METDILHVLFSCHVWKTHDIWIDATLCQELPRSEEKYSNSFYLFKIILLPMSLGRHKMVSKNGYDGGSSRSVSFVEKSFFISKRHFPLDNYLQPVLIPSCTEELVIKIPFCSCTDKVRSFSLQVFLFTSLNLNAFILHFPTK